VRGGGEKKGTVCPAFAELISSQNGGRTRRIVDAVQRHVSSCPRCTFALGLFERLLREKLTAEEKALLNSMGPSKRAGEFRRFAKNLQ